MDAIEQIVRDSPGPDLADLIDWAGDDADDSAVAEPAPGGSTHTPAVQGYRVIAKIGEGGMSTVWRAVQLATCREVALKLARGAWTGSDRVRRRFEREVELAARLEHPNIARVYDSIIRDGVCVYAMELFAEGLHLDRYVKTAGAANRQVLELMRTICRAVQHAHQRCVIHRDLKPSNILVTPDGQPHVLDFGMAKSLLDDSESSISLDGAVAGTPQYMSPEQAAGLPVDTRSDVYSLGVVLYQLLTGRSPHDRSGSRAAVLRRIAAAGTPLPNAAFKSIDGELRALLQKALAPAPEDRYSSAGELGRDLDNYLRGEPLTARRPTLRYVLWRRTQKHLTSVTVTTLVALLLCTITTYSMVKIHYARDEGRALAYDRQVEWARGLIFQADAATEGHLWLDAAELYRKGHAELSALHVPTDDADLGLWNLNRLAAPPIAVFPARGAKVRSVAFTPDGQRLLTASTDNVLEFREARTSRLVWRIVLPTTATALHVLPDGLRVLWTGTDGSVRLWDLASATELHCFATGGYFSMPAVSPDARYVACGGQRNQVAVWDIGERRVVHTLTGHKDIVMDVAFSRDGRSLVSVGQDGVANLWDVEAQKVTNVLRPITPGHGLSRVCWSPDERLVAYGGVDKAVWLHNLSTAATTLLGSHAGEITGLSFSPDGTRLLSSSADSTLRVWDLMHPGQALTLSGHGQHVSDAKFSPDGSVIASGGWDQRVKLWSARGGPEMLTLPGEEPGATTEGLTSVAFSPDGRLVACTGYRGWIRIRDVATGKQIQIVHGQEPDCLGSGMAFGFCFAPDGKHLVSGGWIDHVVRIWGVGSVKEPVRLGYHDDRVFSVAVSPDGNWLASADEGGVVKKWHAAGLANRMILHRFGHTVRRLAFASGGKRLLASRSDGVMDMLDFETGNVIWESTKATVQNAPVFTELRDDIAGLISPDGRTIASASLDNSLRLWSIADGTLLVNLGGHDNGVYDIAFFPDGDRILSTGGDAVLKVWDMSSQRMLHRFADLHHVPMCVAVGSDALHAAVGCNLGEMLLCDFSAAARFRSLGRFADDARLKLETNPNDSTAFVSLGKWYAARGADAWAADCYTRAIELGAAVDPLSRARTDWRLGRLAEARREFEAALASVTDDGTRWYLQVCLDAVGRDSGK